MYQHGDDIKFIARGGVKLGKILAVKYHRTKNPSYEVGVLNEKNEVERWKVNNESGLSAPTPAEVSHINTYWNKIKEYNKELQEHKQKIYNKDQEKYLSIGHAVCRMFSSWEKPTNLKVMINYTNGVKEETVTGKTATGICIKSRKKAIPWRFVDRLVFEEKKIPITLTEERRTQIFKNGLVLVGRNNGEFIVSSVCVANSPSGLFAPNAYYECPSRLIFRDPDENLYWREAGSSD